MRQILVTCIFVIMLFQIIFSQERYHILKFSETEPIIEKRCVPFIDIKKNDYGYLEETIDSCDRCIRLEFFVKPDAYFTAIDLPSIVEYTWTDSSVIEFLYDDRKELLSVDGKFIRPNKIEYIINKYGVTKIKKYFNDKFINSSIIVDGCSLDEATFFLMYSGCNVKYNKKYKIRF